MAGLYVGIIYVIVLTYMTSCTNHRRTERDTNPRNPIGELTLYYPNGNDTTIIVSNTTVYTSSETIRYCDMDGISNTTTLDFHYTQYRK